MGGTGEKVSRSSGECGISLRLGSKLELRCNGGWGPFHTSQLCAPVLPLAWWYLLGHRLGLISSSLQERWAHLPTQLCEFAMRIRVQAGVSRGTGGGSSQETWTPLPTTSSHLSISSTYLATPFLQLEGTRKEILVLCPFAILPYLISTSTPFPEASQLLRKKALSLPEILG